MRLRLFVCLPLLMLAVSVWATKSIAQTVQIPERRPNVEGSQKSEADAQDDDDDDDDDKKPAKRADDDDEDDKKPAKRADDDDADDDDDKKPARRARGDKDDKDDDRAKENHDDRDDDEVDKATLDRREDGLPSIPTRAPPLSQRGIRQSSEPLGPVLPPDKWSDEEVSQAKSRCDALLKPGRFEFQALEPIREGVCGAPAPIRLKYMDDVPRVEVRPAATMTCPLADALDRWMREVVQPRAKALLHANVIRLGNLSAYQCRTRYGSPSERMSYHAFAEAVDVGEFVTAKGEHITVLEHWPLKDERSQFLREIHDGACKIFGTVLGPGANAAHHNHFHLDLAKRRYSAYCQ